MPEAKKTKKLKKELTGKGKAGAVVVSAPLTTPQSERAERSAVYAKTKSDVAVWDSVVHGRRSAQQLSFPIEKRPDVKLPTATESARGFKAKTPMEMEIAALLAGSKSTVKTGKELSEREESILANMTMQAALEKRRELARIRALQSYQEAKLRRQNKIKSRKYRKLQRKAKEKEKQRELEELHKTNPELALEKLAELDKTRIAERASLKHRNSSKYLQTQARKAKNNKDSQQAVQETLQRHRTLMQKKASLEALGAGDDDDAVDGDENDGELEEVVEEGQEESDNPWISVVKKKPKVADKSGEDEASLAEFHKNFKSYWNEENERRKSEKALAAKKKQETLRERLDMAGTVDDLFNEAEMIMRDKIKQKLKGGDDDDESGEEENEFPENPEYETEALKLKTDEQRPTEAKKKKTTEKEKPPLEEDKVVKTTDLGSKAEKVYLDGGDASGGEENMDDDADNEDDEQAKAIAEAFADDDVVADFRSEKQAAIEAEKPKDLDTFLPGWGSWGGEGIKISKRKRRRFIIKAPPAPKRRDENKGNLILNDHKQSSVSKHQMSTVPFPFESVAAVEANNRLPIGETFMPRNAYKKLTAPRVKTNVGQIIEPMNKEELVKRNLVKKS